MDSEIGTSGGKITYTLRNLLGWLIFGRTSLASRESRPVSCVTTGDIRSAQQLAEMYEIDFSDIRSLEKAHSIKLLKAIAAVEVGTEFVDILIVFRTSWRDETKIEH